MGSGVSILNTFLGRSTNGIIQVEGQEYGFFPVWHRNTLISTGTELVLSHTEKTCIATYYTKKLVLML